MGLDTVLVAVGEEDSERTDAIARAVSKITAPADAHAVVVHALRPSEYERAAETLPAPGGGSGGSFTVTSFGGATREAPQQSEQTVELSQSEALERIIRQKGLIRDLDSALDDCGVDYEIRGEVGDPAERVLAVADEVDADFVLVGGRDRSTTRKALFGSVSQEILQSTDCPVISIREGVDG